MFPFKTLTLTLGLSILTGLSTQAHSETPQLGFDSRPNYLPSNAIALTFDDGVDVVNTPQILNILRDKGVRGTFFLNANNFSGQNDPGVADLINRIVNEGHGIGNHTNHHLSLPSLSDDSVRFEISSVEDLVRSDTNGRVSRLTLLRAPFGDGFQGGIDDRIANIVSQYAVHVGWNFDSFDYNCEASAAGAQCVYDGVFGPINQGSYGVVLMHSVHPQTVAALGRVIDDLRGRGFQFWTVEQVVQSKYGRPSNQLVGVQVPAQANQPNPPNHPAGGGSCAGVQAWTEEGSYHIGDKVVFENQLFTDQNEDSGPGNEPKISTWFWAAGPMCN